MTRHDRVAGDGRVRVVIVTGSRDLDDYGHFAQALENTCPSMIVQGGCPTGADAMARRWAREHDVPCKTFAANWAEHGKAAGPRRNRRMLDAYPRAIVLGFPRGGPGTRNCLEEARRRWMAVIEK